MVKCFFFYKSDFLLNAWLHEPGCGDVYPDIISLLDTGILGNRAGLDVM